MKGISNLIELNPQINNDVIKNKIEDALRRQAEIDARRIFVETEGHVVTLSGNVKSWSEKKQAENAAWAAPGIVKVINKLNVVP